MIWNYVLVGGVSFAFGVLLGFMILALCKAAAPASEEERYL